MISMTINQIMKEAVRLDASDIFITVGVPPTFKVHGMLQAMPDADKLTPADTEEYAQQLFVKERDYQAFLEQGERDFSLSLPDTGRFRVNVFNQRGSYAVSIRRIYTKLPDPDELGLPESVMMLADKIKGLVLVTGPTGCGKTTTLAALIDKINRNRACHVLTLEDPIEYLHHHQRSIINQREIGTDSQSYQLALRAALRQSPDVIQIGEMRDLETISIALTAAETGHLVLSTLHTVGAAKTIDRIIDVFPSDQQQQVRVQLSTVLLAVVSQQLIPSEQAEAGRVPAFEVMIVNSAIRNMIREGKTPQIDGVIQMNRAQGMVSMDTSLADLYKRGLISQEDAMHYCVNHETLQRYINQQ
jgi:twitching motility protein PilT